MNDVAFRRKAVRQRYVLVVRYGFAKDIDAIDELDKIFKSNHNVWFGKFGQRLGGRTAEDLLNQEQSTLVLLIRSRSSQASAKHRSKIYTLSGVSQTPPSDQRLYPSYYKRHMESIGTWLRLQNYDGPNVDLSQLYVRSSGSRVTEALTTSMRGFFLCRLRADI